LKDTSESTDLNEINTEKDIQDAELSRRGLWSEDEDAKLLKAYQELGPRWPLIANRVIGRNQRQCEKRFRRIKKSMEEHVQQSEVNVAKELLSLADLSAEIRPSCTPVPCQ
jgi:hypothetical protein